MRFLCGCTSDIDGAAPLSEEIFRTFETIALDEEGFLVCLVHHQRRYGWRTVPYSAVSMLPDAKASWTPAEYERWLYWGEYPISVVAS